MMVSAVSGSGAVSGESVDSSGWDEEGFASILASLVGTPPDASGEQAPLLAVAGRDESEQIPGGARSGPEPSTETRADVAAGDETIRSAGDFPAFSTGDSDGVVRGAASRAGRDLARSDAELGFDADVVRLSGATGTNRATPLLAQVGGAVADMDAPIMGDVGHEVIERVVADRMGAVAPGLTEGTVPAAEAASGASVPVSSDGVSGVLHPDAGSWRSPIDTDPSPDAGVDDPSSLVVEESVGSEATDDVRPLGPSVRVEPASGRVSPPDALMDVGAPSDHVSDAVTGVETGARAEAIREVVEWLEGVGLESTPGEMRVEIPDGEGELVVRVAVVDGRLEIDASGPDGNLAERWLDDLRRELDARGFDFAGRRQGREGGAHGRDESGTAPGVDTPRTDRHARPGVLL